MKLSEESKKLRAKVWLLRVISFLLLFGPLMFYFGQAAWVSFIAGTTTATVAKVSIFSTSLILFGILTIIAAARKVVFKSSLWVLVVAIYLLLDSVMYAVVIIGACQIIDELAIQPLLNHFKDRLKINKEIDRRG